LRHDRPLAASHVADVVHSAPTLYDLREHAGTSDDWPGREKSMRSRYLLAIGLWLAGSACGETLTLPADQRPEWLARDGIVMAGS